MDFRIFHSVFRRHYVIIRFIGVDLGYKPLSFPLGNNTDSFMND